MANRVKKSRQKLGNKIQKLRKVFGLSQEELAYRAGISRTHMGHVEQGRKTPSLSLLEKIVKILKIKLGDLFGN